MGTKISRRAFLRGVGTATGVVGVNALLAACGQEAAPAAPAAPAATTAPDAPAAPAATTAPAAEPAAAAKTIHGIDLPADAAPYDQQVYRAMVFAEPPHFDRSAGVSSSGSFFPFYFGDPLVKLNEDGELVGAIAESWKLEDDGLTWTFKLREGLLWSDGTPLTAEDVVFTYQRIADPAVAFDWRWFFLDIKNFAEISAGEMDMSELGVKAVDELTFQAVMNAPAPYFPDKTLMLTIVPKHILKTTDASPNWSVDPATAISCGPWKLTRWDKGKEIVFDVNENYKGPLKPYIKTIVLKVGSAEAVMPAYEAGEIDAIAYEGLSITPADIARAQADPVAWGMHSYVDYGAYYLILNNKIDPFTNTKLRQAINYAIDREALANSVGRGQSVPAFAMLPPGFPAHNPELKELQTFNLERAKQLLSEAGYADGSELGKLVLTTHGPLNSLRKGWVEGVQAQLKENLNIDIEIVVQEIKVFYAERTKHEFAMTFQQYQFDYVDPSNLLGIWKSDGSLDYNNPEYDALIAEADHFVGSREDRIALYQQAERMLVEDASAVFLFWPEVTQFWRPYLKGASLEPNKNGVQAFRGNKLGLTHYNMYITKDRPSI